ncbi:MAG: TonB-dependent receptor [Ferruginibacter sp.]
MLKLSITCASMLFASAVLAQQPISKTDTTHKAIVLDEVVLSSGNFEEKKKNIAQRIELLSSKHIEQSMSQNTGDLLLNTGKIFVQKSQQGGSSPVIRGFEASRILLVIDGVRLNNAIFRSGHLQNIITNDQNSLRQVEVMYGPSSTTYGSDALGGSIQLLTKNPILSSTIKLISKGTTFFRYSSANEEKTIHADVSLGGKKLAWFQSYNYSDFGDMKMGSNYPDKYPNFGRRSQYIETINGVDIIQTNSNDKVQKFTAFKQWDIIEKVLFKPNDKQSHLLNIQFSNSSDVPRYDRLQDVRNGNLRFASWYYGPQKRVLAAYEMNLNQLGFVDELKLNVNFQDIEESRQNRDYLRYDRFDSRKENIKVWGATLAARKKMERNEITLGVDAQLNDLTSTAFRKNLITGTLTALDTRYPDGKNNVNHFGLYVQHIYKSTDGKWVLNDGIRFQLSKLHSTIINNSFLNLPITNIEQNNAALTGNIGLVYNANKKTILKAVVSTGFRAPNIDDLSKIFESSTAAKQVIVPNASIKPEYTYGVDFTIQHQLTDKVNINLNSFYTLFRNALVKAPYQLNGQDSIIYNGIKSQVLANQNFNKAYLYGFAIDLLVNVASNLSATSTISYTYGRFKTDATKNSAVYEKQVNGTYNLVQKKVAEKPLDHIPPLIGRTSFNYRYKKLNAEISFLYNGWKRLDQYNADGEDNAQYATADGMPAWVIANFKCSIPLTKGLLLQAGVENIFDRNYRYFASGFSAAGRNFQISLRSSW